jgi:hypothetical protein
MVTHVIDRHRWDEITDGAVLQEDGRIVEIGSYQELSRKHPNVAVVGSGKEVMLPGFVNGHHHIQPPAPHNPADGGGRARHRPAVSPARATEAITAYYLAPKSPDMTCPMIALAPDAARRPSDNPLRQAYVAGVRGMFNMFAELAAANGSEATDDRLRVLFAGMVGSNMLARAADGEASTFRQAAIAASATKPADRLVGPRAKA